MAGGDPTRSCDCQFSFTFLLMLLSIKTPMQKKKKKKEKKKEKKKPLSKKRLLMNHLNKVSWYFNEFLRYLYTNQCKIQANKGIKSLCRQHWLQFFLLAYESVSSRYLDSYIRIHVKLDSFLIFQKPSSFDHQQKLNYWFERIKAYRSFTFPKFIVDIQCLFSWVSDSKPRSYCLQMQQNYERNRFANNSPPKNNKDVSTDICKISAQDFVPLVSSPLP